MADFTERIHLKGKAEEDIYFAKLNRKLIAALREKQTTDADPKSDKTRDKDNTSHTVQK
ncbi:MAG: hypothetical protein ACJAT7_001155 [Psychromonas sp.]|jgi:hypothetical protein|uniref:hypothetical protein n=1 Tax=Psychromonas sp. TaxID=1884585 RepID=UPI0039E4DE7B